MRIIDLTLPISGLFDLRPLLETQLNAEFLRLDAEEAVAEDATEEAAAEDAPAEEAATEEAPAEEAAAEDGPHDHRHREEERPLKGRRHDHHAAGIAGGHESPGSVVKFFRIRPFRRIGGMQFLDKQVWFHNPSLHHRRVNCNFRLRVSR